MTPLSVVVPTHGRTTLFAETLRSLERQTLDAFEVIVTDDSSAPGDRRFIEGAVVDYEQRTGRPACYLFTRPRLGQAANTNQGLRRARGTLTRILHSDDVLAPRALEAEVALMNDGRLNLQVLYHHVEPFEDAPHFAHQPSLTLVQPSLLFRTMLHSGTPLPSATVFRRDLLDAVGLMREDFDFLCDWDFLTRLLLDQCRRQRFIGMLSRGFVGWRTHHNSATGRLWHRHFLEHERFMEEIRRDRNLTEALIGDRRSCDEFFATAVRYRYRRLSSDVSRMRPWHALKSAGTIVRCALSPASIKERTQWAPWTKRGGRKYGHLVVNYDAAPVVAEGAHAVPRFVEPRKGLKFVLSAYASAAVVRWGKTYASAYPDPEPAVAAGADTQGPGLVDIGRRVEVRSSLAGPGSRPGAVLLLTEFNNSMNLWPLRRLIGAASDVVVFGINANALVEPVLHQCLKLLSSGAHVEFPIADNRHLTSFGFKALLDHAFPGQFAWVEQAENGPRHRVLRYRRQRAGHDTYTAPHTGWTFGMLTTGARLDNVERFIESIEQSCPESYEILLVSPVDLGDLSRRPRVRVIPFSEHDDLGWITKKKNLICFEAAYSDILVCHDRFWLTGDFTATFSDWGYAYGLTAPRVRLPDGSRGLDWAVVSSQNRVWSTGGLLDYRAYSQYAYNPGGATIIRKAFWRDFPWNENLFWNEHEDVELCRRIQRAGGLIALTTATLTSAEDRWVHENPLIPYCDQNDVLYGGPVGEQRICFLPRGTA